MENCALNAFEIAFTRDASDEKSLFFHERRGKVRQAESTGENEFVTSLKVNVAGKGLRPANLVKGESRIYPPRLSRRTCTRGTIYCVFLAR